MGKRKERKEDARTGRASLAHRYRSSVLTPPSLERKTCEGDAHQAQSARLGDAGACERRGKTGAQIAVVTTTTWAACEHLKIDYATGFQCFGKAERVALPVGLSRATIDGVTSWANEALQLPASFLCCRYPGHHLT